MHLIIDINLPDCIVNIMKELVKIQVASSHVKLLTIATSVSLAIVELFVILSQDYYHYFYPLNLKLFHNRYYISV